MNYDNIINKLEQLPWVLIDSQLICSLPNKEMGFKITMLHFIIFEGNRDYYIVNEDVRNWGKKKLVKEIDKREEELFNTIISKFQTNSLGPYR